MSEYIEYVSSCPKVICDGCARRATGPTVPGYAGTEAVRFRAELEAQGWQAWAGRSLRHYCPDCAPKPGHKMRRILPRLGIVAPCYHPRSCPDCQLIDGPCYGHRVGVQGHERCNGERTVR